MRVLQSYLPIKMTGRILFYELPPYN